MQFHLNGFQNRDPEIREASPHALPHGEGVPQQVDVLVVGAGPAGLTLAAQMANFPDIRTCLVEQKEGPINLGQADGIACRTMEMFEAFNFSERVGWAILRHADGRRDYMPPYIRARQKALKRDEIEMKRRVRSMVRGG